MVAIDGNITLGFDFGLPIWWKYHKSWNLGQKSKLQLKIWILIKNINFGKKSKFRSKMEILVKNGNSGQIWQFLAIFFDKYLATWVELQFGRIYPKTRFWAFYVQNECCRSDLRISNQYFFVSIWPTQNIFVTRKFFFPKPKKINTKNIFRCRE